MTTCPEGGLREGGVEEVGEGGVGEGGVGELASHATTSSQSSPSSLAFSSAFHLSTFFLLCSALYLFLLLLAAATDVWRSSSLGGGGAGSRVNLGHGEVIGLASTHLCFISGTPWPAPVPFTTPLDTPPLQPMRGLGAGSMEHRLEPWVGSLSRVRMESGLGVERLVVAGVHVWDFPTQALHPTSTPSTSSLQETSTSPLHQQLAGRGVRGLRRRNLGGQVNCWVKLG